MRVELRITGPARPMPERRADQPAADEAFRAVVPTADEHRFPLEIPDRGGDRVLVGGDDLPRRALGHPTPTQTDTDFGAENVRSNAGTRRFGRPSALPSRGFTPWSSETNASSLTNP